MRLSQLKQMILDIETNQRLYPSNPDPLIDFWVPRSPRLTMPDSYESDHFVEFEIDFSEEVRQHCVQASDKSITMGKGDYTIPLLITNFYKPGA